MAQFLFQIWTLRSWCLHNILFLTILLGMRTFCSLTPAVRWLILTARFLYLAGYCSLRFLFYVARYYLIPARCLPITSFYSLVAADISLLAGLYSLHAAHCTSSCSLVVPGWSYLGIARCSPFDHAVSSSLLFFAVDSTLRAAIFFVCCPLLGPRFSFFSSISLLDCSS